MQSAVNGSYLSKLQELADNDSCSSTAGDGTLVLFTPGFSTAAQLHRFLGITGLGEEEAGTAAAEQQQQLAQRLLEAAVPAAVWQRCKSSALRVCWLLAPSPPAGSSEEEEASQLALLPALQALLQQQSQRSVAAELSELAGNLSQQEFAARLMLPAPQATEVGPSEADAGVSTEDEPAWPAAAGSAEEALEGLKFLRDQLEGHKGEGRGRALTLGAAVAFMEYSCWLLSVLLLTCPAAVAQPCLQHCFGTLCIACPLLSLLSIAPERNCIPACRTARPRARREGG
jgi:hypothetical protein